MEVIGCNTFVA